MHVFVSPAPLLRHTYCKTSAPLNATVTGVPLITTAEWGETAQARTKLLLLVTAFAGYDDIVPPCVDITLVGSHAHEPRWRLLSHEQCGGPLGRNLRNATIDPGWEPNAGRSFRKEKVDTSYREHRSWGVGDVEFQGMLGWGTALHPYRGTSVPLRIWCLLHAIRIP